MNLNHLSDNELLDYLDRYSEDPVVVRLVGFLRATHGGLISDLEAAGMDPMDWTFRSDSYNRYYPGQYITHLEREVEYAEEELELAQRELEDANEEIRKLKARTVVQLLTEMENQVSNAKANAYSSQRETERVTEENKTLREKLGMWTILATE